MVSNNSSHNPAHNIGSEIILFIVALLVSASCNSAVHLVKDSADKPIVSNSPVQLRDSVPSIAKIAFDSTTYHFGEIRKGDKLYREIYFTNLGPGNLQIELISACECTSLDWTRLPVKPGEKSKIKITYDSKDKTGQQIVDIEVTANTVPPASYAKFKLYVMP